MSFAVKGYVLEPPRISTSNSAYTSTPNVVVLDPVAYSAHFTEGLEGVPRVDYFVMVVPDGQPGDNRFLVDARFGWTKNEGTLSKPLQRFDFDGSAQSFKLLPGAPIVEAGKVSAAANVSRLKVLPPIEVLPGAPFRLSYGQIGSGTTLAVSLVTDFSVPPVGTVEIKRTTGELNWNPADLIGLSGQPVRFQQQQFYPYAKSTGRIGTVATSALILNPLPASGQFPMVKIDQGFWLTPVEVPNEAALVSGPPPGEVWWAATTGLLRLNPQDMADHPGADVYYDGVLIAWRVQLPRQNLGTVLTPSPIGVPPAGGDIIFHIPGGHQFPAFSVVSGLSQNGTYGVVEVRASDGAVKFSTFDRNLYGASTAEAVFGDLPLEHGIALRLYRSLVNPGATQDSPGDLALCYTTKGATLARPILPTPQVALPSLPIVDPLFDLLVNVEPGTGSYVGTLPNLDVPAPLPGLGYTLDFSTKQLRYAERKNDVLTTLPVSVGATPLPDPLLVGANYEFALEIAPNTGVFSPLAVGADLLLDPIPGVVTFTSPWGTLLGSGLDGAFTGTVFQDLTSTLTTEAGDLLVIAMGTAKGVYRVAAGNLSVGVQTDLDPTQGILVDHVGYDVRRSPEVVADRYWKPIELLDPNTQVEKIRLLGHTQNQEVLVGLGQATFQDTTTVGAPLTDFVAAGVRVGDTLVILSGPDSGKAYLITGVQQHTVIVGTPVTFISLPQTFKVVRRLRVPVLDSAHTRFRFGQTSYTEQTTTVEAPTDQDFTDPAFLNPGYVEISAETGNLNFSAPDVLGGLPVFWVRELIVGRDYKLQPRLAFIDFTERFLSGEEALVTYIPLDGAGEPLPSTAERVSFALRKEQTPARTIPTNTVFFNPLARTVAANPAPSVFRGGRPQVLGQQCRVDTQTSTVTFLPDAGYMTDALPHGDLVGPDERIYVDYSVYEAVGGEKNVTVLNPMSVAQVVLLEDATSFTVEGDYRADFPPGYLLKVDREDVFRIASSVYSGTTTTITLDVGERVSSNAIDPHLYLVSGPTPMAPTTFAGPYFRNESSPYQVVPRGMNRLRVYGNQTATYRSGTILYFTDASGTYSDFYIVVGATLVSGWTDVILTHNTQRQYSPGAAFLKYSIRPILDDGARHALTYQTPVLTEPTGVFRKVSGKAGQLLTSPQDYKLDGAGSLHYATPLQVGEEVGLWYTGNKSTVPGVRLRASYTHVIAPNALNGIENQTLTLDYTVFSPDSFYFRVETLSNFKTEVAQYLGAQAKGTLPVSGPRLRNLGTALPLYGQGRESDYFREGHLANQDIVAQRFLKYLHDNVNHLEDTLQSIDGRLVGANQGRFRYDGNTNNPVRTQSSQVTNEIDDTFQVSTFPYFVTFNPFHVTYVGTFAKLYEAGDKSRLYPEVCGTLFNTTIAGQDTDAHTGEPILDFRQKSLTWTPPVVSRRLPRGLVVQEAPAGATTLYLDNATGSPTFIRPSFQPGMRVQVQAFDGTDLVGAASAIAVTGVLGGSPESLQLATPLPVVVPRGATVVLCTAGPVQDTTYQKSYRVGTDVSLDTASGRLLYIEPYWPFEGSLSPFPIPDQFVIQAPNSQEILQMTNVGVQNTRTAPYRFPALDGGAENDSHDMGLPIQTKTFDCEVTYVGDTDQSLTDLLASTTPANPITGVTLSPAHLTLTHTGLWPTPTIQVFDLVRFLSGPNATAGFRRIVSVTGATLVVDYPFPAASTSETILVTAGPNVTSGTCTFVSPTLISDPAGLLAAEPGQTVIFTTLAHPNVGERRQIVAKPTPSTATLDYPVVVSPPTSAYRVSNHISTYSALEAQRETLHRILEVVETNDHPAAPKVDSEILGIQRFFDGDPVRGTDGILTDLLSPAADSGLVSGTTLTGSAGTDFVVAGVNSSHFVYLEAGGNQGFYKVASVGVPGHNVLTVASPFPFTGSVSYRVVKSYGVLLAGLQDLFSVLQAAQEWASSCTAWLGHVNETVPVYVAPGGLSAVTWANNLLTGEVQIRQIITDARSVYLGDAAGGPSIRVENTLKSRDQFYSKRYTWIDGRANVQRGFLYLKERAITTRQNNVVQRQTDLIRLLTLDIP